MVKVAKQVPEDCSANIEERRRTDVIRWMARNGAHLTSPKLNCFGFGLATYENTDDDFSKRTLIAVETIPNLCCKCQGEGEIRKNKYDILKSTCPDCLGVGKRYPRTEFARMLMRKEQG